MFRFQVLICVLLFICSESIYAVQCQARKGVLAQYEITRQNTKSGKTIRFQVELWRKEKKVAIHNTKTGITELWEPTNNQKLHLVRYFEDHRRGIEYQPGEINGAHDWSLKRQLVANDYIRSLSKVSQVGSGCETVEMYEKGRDVQKFSLRWMPKQQLVQSYSEVDNENIITWTLKRTEVNANLIEAKFARLASFETTDYTDIGDNESDPFLAQMINMGFIEHGSSGFYHSNGQPIESRHYH